METQIKIIIEKHVDGYVAYPLGVKGVVVGQGDSYQAALDDVQSAIAFHLETFGADSILETESPVVEAFLAEANIASG
ncbi:MAG: type II toxin-antitoxin system HicB family antitoxin [Gammaproteobacteria bacterium]|nr:type II toxin-antitoxin system HicB family antitoxin [Gammaproteobacteria bacterium]